MLTFRRVTLADRPAMLEICATVWEGDDYVPLVFDEWVAAPDGQFTALEQEGRVAALGRLAQFAPGEFWLEGIRVHADCRGRGLAAALHDYHLALWRRIGGPGTLRLVTAVDNAAIVKLCERTGFARLFEFTFATAPAAMGTHGFTPLTPAEAGRASDVIAHSPALADLHGMFDLGWRWRTLTPACLANSIAAGAAYRWAEWEGVLLTAQWSDEDADAHELCIQLPAVARERRAAFLTDVRALAGALGRTRVRWSPLARPDVLDDLPRAGYARLWEDVLCCYEIRQ
jgi:GNAT superfamily N-acetyltransferase